MRKFSFEFDYAKFFRSSKNISVYLYVTLRDRTAMYVWTYGEISMPKIIDISFSDRILITILNQNKKIKIERSIISYFMVLVSYICKVHNMYNQLFDIPMIKKKSLKSKNRCCELSMLID